LNGPWRGDGLRLWRGCWLLRGGFRDGNGIFWGTLKGGEAAFEGANEVGEFVDARQRVAEAGLPDEEPDHCDQEDDDEKIFHEVGDEYSMEG
jgi:hypothetical protein